MEYLIQLWPIIKHHTMISLGDGKQTNFWTDLWLAWNQSSYLFLSGDFGKARLRLHNLQPMQFIDVENSVVSGYFDEIYSCPPPSLKGGHDGFL